MIFGNSINIIWNKMEINILLLQNPQDPVSESIILFLTQKKMTFEFSTWIISSSWKILSPHSGMWNAFWVGKKERKKLEANEVLATANVSRAMKLMSHLRIAMGFHIGKVSSFHIVPFGLKVSVSWRRMCGNFIFYETNKILSFEYFKRAAKNNPEVFKGQVALVHEKLWNLIPQDSQFSFVNLNCR